MYNPGIYSRGFSFMGVSLVSKPPEGVPYI